MESSAGSEIAATQCAGAADQRQRQAFPVHRLEPAGLSSFVLYKTKEFNSKGNCEGGAKLGYTGNDGPYEIALFARDITNEKNLKGVIENYMAAACNEPRIIGVSFTGKID
jgi:hypothetical protein